MGWWLRSAVNHPAKGQRRLKNQHYDETHQRNATVHLSNGAAALYERCTDVLFSYLIHPLYLQFRLSSSFLPSPSPPTPRHIPLQSPLPVSSVTFTSTSPLLLNHFPLKITHLPCSALPISFIVNQQSPIRFAFPHWSTRTSTPTTLPGPLLRPPSSSCPLFSRISLLFRPLA